MTRIGFAYNQRPVPLASAHGGATADAAVPHDDNRILGAHARVELAPEADDEFAEWDTPATIDAVEAALRPLGEVIRLEAVGDFADRLRAARPDIVFNIAEGLHGPNREAHIPAICEFVGVPYTASDPFTLSLCLDKARTKEALSARRVRTAPWMLVQEEADIALAIATLPFPVFAKPVHEGSSKGITERTSAGPRSSWRRPHASSSRDTGNPCSWSATSRATSSRRRSSATGARRACCR